MPMIVVIKAIAHKVYCWAHTFNVRCLVWAIKRKFHKRKTSLCRRQKCKHAICIGCIYAQRTRFEMFAFWVCKRAKGVEQILYLLHGNHKKMMWTVCVICRCNAERNIWFAVVALAQGRNVVECSTFLLWLSKKKMHVSSIVCRMGPIWFGRIVKCAAIKCFGINDMWSSHNSSAEKWLQLRMPPLFKVYTP